MCVSERDERGEYVIFWWAGRGGKKKRGMVRVCACVSVGM